MTQLRRTTGVSETAVEGDLYLVHPDSQEIYHLDTIATALWRLLAEPQGEEELVAAFAEAFPAIEGARLRADIDHAVTTLLEQGLLERD